MELQVRHEKKTWLDHVDDEQETAHAVSETFGFASLIVCIGLQMPSPRAFLFPVSFFLAATQTTKTQNERNVLMKPIHYIPKLLTLLLLLGHPQSSQALFPKKQFTIKIQRNMTCKDKSTIGVLYINGVKMGRTLELPWRNNESNISHIPPKKYDAFIRRDGKRGWRIQLRKVKNRKYIQIHIGNYQRQIKGCVLVGATVTKNKNGTCMVNHSRKTLKKIAAAMSKFARGKNKTRKAIPITVHIKK